MLRGANESSQLIAKVAKVVVRNSFCKMPRTKKAQTYSVAEVNTLLELVETMLPIGQNEWESVVVLFNRSMYNLVGTNAVPRDYESLRNKFKSLRNNKKPTGDPTCPPEVRRAKRAQREMEKRMSVADLDDDAADEEDGEEEEEEEGEDEDEDEDEQGDGAANNLNEDDEAAFQRLLEAGSGATSIAARPISSRASSAAAAAGAASVSSRGIPVPAISVSSRGVSAGGGTVSSRGVSAGGGSVSSTSASARAPRKRVQVATPIAPSRTATPIGPTLPPRAVTPAAPLTGRVGMTEAQLRAMSVGTVITPSETVRTRNRLDTAIEALVSTSTTPAQEFPSCFSPFLLGSQQLIAYPQRINHSPVKTLLNLL